MQEKAILLGMVNNFSMKKLEKLIIFSLILSSLIRVPPSPQKRLPDHPSKAQTDLLGFKVSQLDVLKRLKIHFLSESSLFREGSRIAESVPSSTCVPQKYGWSNRTLPHAWKKVGKNHT